MSANPAQTRRINAFLQIAFAGIIFLGLNYLGNAWLGPIRADLTNDGLFSISPGTETILTSLEGPITLKFYFSETVAGANPAIFRYGRRVQDLLEEFEAASDGKISLEVIDPLPFSTEKEEAESFGLQGVPAENGVTIFLGLVGFDDTNRLEVISAFSEDRERFLEFDVAKIIYLLVQDKKPKVAILTNLPMRFGPGGAVAYMQGLGQPYLIYRQLSQFFDVVYLENNFNVIPNDVDLLLLVHPPEMSAEQLFEVDQFILGNKPAMIFVDPFAEVSPLVQQNAAVTFSEQVPLASDLAALFENWGIEYNPDQAVVDFNRGQAVSVGAEQNAVMRNYIHWLGLRSSEFNADNPITAFLSTMNFASSGALGFDGREGLSFSPLVQTSDGADLVPAVLVREDVDANVLVQTANPAGQYTLIGRLTGTAQTAFPEGVGNKSGLTQGPINVIIGADADIFEDRFWASIRRDNFGRDVLIPIADNAAFIINSIDYLSGSESLISLRPRGVSKRPLEKFQELRRTATEQEEAEKSVLRTRLREVEARLTELEKNTPEGEAYNSASEAEIQNFRNQAMGIQRNLNQVQRNLTANIKTLETKVILMNMFIIPGLLLGLVLLRFGFGKRKRRQ